MKGIYLLAMTAVVAMCLTPIASEDDEGASVGFTIEYQVDGEWVARGSGLDLNVPELPYKEGKRFIGWYATGPCIYGATMIMDVYDFDFSEPGIYYLTARWEPISEPVEPSNEEPASNYIWTIAAVAGIIALIGITAYLIKR